ncbi:hypothetical protein OF83DRAFT_475596 [Amylostereum chailletii]|nr:hypothetical protein OF83DRAFT_475596 [Amylostereum chailletii]
MPPIFQGLSLGNDGMIQAKSHTYEPVHIFWSTKVIASYNGLLHHVERSVRDAGDTALLKEIHLRPWKTSIRLDSPCDCYNALHYLCRLFERRLARGFPSDRWGAIHGFENSRRTNATKAVQRAMKSFLEHALPFVSLPSSSKPTRRPAQSSPSFISPVARLPVGSRAPPANLKAYRYYNESLSYVHAGGARRVASPRPRPLGPRNMVQ